jgi:hypothetical protein
MVLYSLIKHVHNIFRLKDSELNVHTPSEDKVDDVKDGFYEEVAYVFDQFPRYDMKMLFGDFNAKVSSN